MKYRNLKKRFLSAALAGVVAVSMAVPAFAADGGDEEESGGGADTPAANTVVITGSYQDVEIAVTVPTTGSVQINPYGLNVDVKDADDAVLATIEGQQIVTMPLAIANNSSMNLSVGAEVTSKINSATGTTAMKFATASTSGLTGTAANAKSAFVYFQMANADGTDAEAEAIAEEFAAWDAEYSAETDIVLKVGSVKKDGLVTLPAAETKTEGEGESATTTTVPSVAMFRLSGDCTSNPTGGWLDSDGFEATVVFSFSVAAE